MTIDAVCHTLLDRVRVHYGVISCNSCRQFFKRSQGCYKPCKNENMCTIERGKYGNQRLRSQCRYEKCLTAGMQRDLLLNDGGKIRKRKKGRYLCQNRTLNQETEIINNPAALTSSNQVDEIRKRSPFESYVHKKFMKRDIERSRMIPNSTIKDVQIHPDSGNLDIYVTNNCSARYVRLI
jgi:hypothetical protein